MRISGMDDRCTFSIMERTAGHSMRKIFGTPATKSIFSLCILIFMAATLILRFFPETGIPERDIRKKY